MLASFGKKEDNIQTPEDLYIELDSEFHFTFDPCSLKSKFDGLKVNWGKSTYVNPPYSDIKPWIEKAIEELKKGNKSVFLIPVRSNNQCWQLLILPNASEIRFIETGVAFRGFKRKFPIPLALIIFDPDKKQNKSRSFRSQKKYNTFVLKMYD